MVAQSDDVNSADADTSDDEIQAEAANGGKVKAKTTKRRKRQRAAKKVLVITKNS